MKILYLLFHGFYASNGISKKILSQVEAMRCCGHEVHVCHYDVAPDGSREWKVDNDVICNLGSGPAAKIRKRLDYRAIEKHLKEGGYDLLYYRYFHNANPFTAGILRAAHKAGTKVVVEVPTYPYDGEFITASEKVKGLLDKTFRHGWFKNVDRTVSFSPCDNIFGCPVTVISNGIDLASIPLRVPCRKEGEMHMIAVAEIHFWHGLDRALKGLAEYYKTPRQTKVYFHIVGEPYGKIEREMLDNLTKEGHIEDYVIRHGALYGKALDDAFNSSDIAIGSLGRHRSGVYVMNSLKNREYAARGFAFVYSETDPDFEGKPFIMKAPADESPLDVASCVEFFDNMNVSPEEIRASVQHLDWKEQMKIVLEQC